MPENTDSTDSTENTESENTESENTEKENTESSDSSESGSTTGSGSGGEVPGDHNMSVRDTGGDGRPVVLIHGWPLSGESWSEQVPALEKAGYRVVVYDRRGFGRSNPGDSYDYDALTDDLDNVLTELDLTDVTLVGFSMGGGEVARYPSRHGNDRLHSVVFAAAVPPALLKSDDNPDGPLDQESADGLRDGLTQDRDGFFENFMTQFFSAGEDLKVTDDQREQALELCRQSDQEAALGCMKAFSTTDFRDDLPNLDVPALIIHGDSDGIVPFEGSGKRTHEALEGSELVVIQGAPHGLNVSHTHEFNTALLAFLEK